MSKIYALWPIILCRCDGTLPFATSHLCNGPVHIFPEPLPVSTKRIFNRRPIVKMVGNIRESSLCRWEYQQQRTEPMQHIIKTFAHSHSDALISLLEKNTNNIVLSR